MPPPSRSASIPARPAAVPGGALCCDWDRAKAFQSSNLPAFRPSNLQPSTCHKEFVTEDLGWSLVFEDNCGQACLLLFKTADGGRSWSALPVDNSAARLP
jgi:hypothetical protein